MSYSYIEGKDEVHFITESDLKEYAASREEVTALHEEIAAAREEDTDDKDAPSAQSAQSETSAQSAPSAQSGAVSEEVQEQYPGAVSESGEINWDCPCLGGMGTEGPCVEEFRSAFSCWMFSAADDQGGEKGDDCVDHFFSMSNCMQQNEEFYDDLNARNKSAAEEALAKYEAEEQEKLAAVEEEQKALENTESETPAVLLAVTETESETKVESITPINPSSVASYVSSEPDFPKGDFSANNSIIVAATLEEQEPELEEDGEEEDSESQDLEKS